MTSPAIPGATRLISREELALLTRRNNAVAAAHLFLRFFFHATLISLGIYVSDQHGVLWGLIVLMPHFTASSFLGWAGIGHELFHNSVFKNRKTNQFLFKVFSILTWSNFGYFQATHPHHHRHTLSSDDAEGAKHAPISFAALIWLLTFDGPAFFRRVKILVMNSIGIVPMRGGNSPLFREGTAQRRNLISAARWVLLVQGGMFLGFLVFEMYWLALTINLAPFCVTFFNRTLAISQHYGLKSQTEGDCFESCRTVIMNRSLAFFYANMNYHVEHHLYPSVPYYNLPALSEQLRNKVSFKNLSTGYLKTLHLLKNQGLFVR